MNRGWLEVSPPGNLVFKEGEFKATWKREFEFQWREAGPPHHYDDKVDSDQ